MKYLEVTFTTHPCNETVNDVVSALAGEIGFESFVECEAGVQAYIQQTLFDEEALKEMIASFPLPDTTVTYTIKEAEDKNWNEEWEKNFFHPSSSVTVAAFTARSIKTPRRLSMKF